MSKISKRLLNREKHSQDPVAAASLAHVENGTSDAPFEEVLDNANSNGIVLTISRSDTTAEMLTAEAEEIDFERQNVNSPYPLPRRSSITDVAHQDSTVRSIVMMLALSLDSVLEGITTGLKVKTAEVWAIFIGNLVHETVIAFCLGLQLIRVQRSVKSVVIAAVAYSLMNPVGLAIATAVFESVESDPRIDLANGLFQALTSGCFIYVTFCEILEGQITHKTSFAKIGAMFAGYAVLAAFAAVPGSSAYDFTKDSNSTNAECTTKS